MECAAEGGGGTRRGSGATQAFWTAHTPSPHEASGVRGTETYQTGPCQCKQTRAKTPSATAATMACPVRQQGSLPILQGEKRAATAVACARTLYDDGRS